MFDRRVMCVRVRALGDERDDEVVEVGVGAHRRREHVRGGVLPAAVEVHVAVARDAGRHRLPEDQLALLLPSRHHPRGRLTGHVHHVHRAAGRVRTGHRRQRARRLHLRALTHSISV